MTLTLEIQSLPKALENATAITVLMSRSEGWGKRRTGTPFVVPTDDNTNETDVLEDVRIERGNPVFESRLRDLQSMVRCGKITEIRKLHGNSLGVWPYKIEIDRTVWQSL